MSQKKSFVHDRINIVDSFYICMVEADVCITVVRWRCQQTFLSLDMIGVTSDDEEEKEEGVVWWYGMV